MECSDLQIIVIVMNTYQSSETHPYDSWGWCSSTKEWLPFYNKRQVFLL